MHYDGHNEFGGAIWTRKAILALESTDLLGNQHLELNQGELINKTGKNRPHITTAALMFMSLVEMFGQMFVQQKGSIDVANQILWFFGIQSLIIRPIIRSLVTYGSSSRFLTAASGST